MRIVMLGTMVAAGLPARAATAVVDTFSFNTTGWGFSAFSGQFSGTVESDGFIELTDLTAFQATGFTGGVPIAISGTGSLSLFSYDTAGGASSLDLIAAFPSEVASAACIGASSTLSPTCNPEGNNPASTRAVTLVETVPFDFTADAPTVTLQSRLCGLS